MRPLEIALLVANAVCLAWVFFRSGQRRSPWRFLLLAPLAFAVLQISIEHFRWQMVPGYAGVAIPALYRKEWLSRPVRILGGLLQLAMIAVSVAAAGVYFPLFSFAPLTGPYSVGTTIQYLTDADRIETHDPGHQAKRQVMVQIWYPAEAVKQAPFATYVQPRAIIGHRWAALSLVKTRALLEPPVSGHGGPFPVILFSPYIGGNSYWYTFVLEELASHGFVVAAIDHPYSSAIVALPDGRTIRNTVDFLDFSSPAKLNESIERVENELKVRVADTLFVLNTLEHWNQLDPRGRFTGRLDTHHAGAMGHSYGGAVAAEASRDDSRIVAVMNVDGWMFGRARTLGVERPFFLVLDNTPMPNAAELNSPNFAIRSQALALKQGSDDFDHTFGAYGGYLLSVPGADHINYSDIPLYSHVHSSSDGVGSIDPRRLHAIFNHYAVAFFTQYLYGRGEPLLNQQPSPYPEVSYRNYNLHGLSAKN